MGSKGRRRRIEAWVAAVVAAVLVAGTLAWAASDAGSAPVTTAFTPVADAYVESSTPTTSYGSTTRLIVDASPTRETFLRFDVSSISGPVQDATLRIHVANTTDAGSPSGGVVARVDDVAWSETGITYANRPTSWGAASVSIGAVARNTWVDVPVTDLVASGGLVTLGLRSTNGDGVYYDSRQAAASVRPQLLVTVDSATTTSTSSTSTSTSSTSSTSTTTTAPPVSGPVTLTPTADVHVDSATPSTNLGSVTPLITDASPMRVAYLRFDLTAIPGPVTDARLRIHVADVLNAESPSGGSVALLNDNSWAELATTYANRPTSWGASLAQLGRVRRNTWVEVPVTSVVTGGGPVSFGIISTHEDGAFYDSREGAAGVRPQLVVSTVAPPSGPGTVVAAVGDAACLPGSGVTTTQCRQLAVSNLIANDPSIQLVLALGDLQYENGTLNDFQLAYDPSYGRFKSKTVPTVGNHEYGTAGAAGYFSYFGAAAGDPAKGYFSYDVGSSWHVVNLNTNCGPGSCAASGAQVQWLRSDLAATSRPCILATGHHPRFSSASGVGNDSGQAAFWDALQQYGADLFLVGHAHDYERFAPQLPSATASSAGIRQFVVGTGGRSLFSFATPVANSQVRLSVFGYLRLVLGDGTYSWQFIDQSGATRDSGSGTCH